MEFTGLPQSDFKVGGIGVPGNSYAGTAGAIMKLRLGMLTFTYQFKQAPGEHSQSAGLRFKF